jgi:crotonobetainyl-CoA:carnitine CoA-transferase CaiB-like acyl-CoA transferase
MTETPLAGIRVLSMEQAVALPYATRHLADLGAEVIRVQSPKRGAPAGGDIDLTRNKRQLALDLATPGGPEAFLRVAARSDIVAHNYTPRVVRQFGIDYEAVRAVRPDIIYVSLTGFGTTGPWGERPLFGPGAEAVAGHNLLIGDPEGWPGRPGTIVYADSTCGLTTAFAVLAALDERDRTGNGQHIDISLYETQVAHLGPVLAERSLGAAPARFANRDVNFLIHGVFACTGLDRHVAIAAYPGDEPALRDALSLARVTPEAVATAVRDRDAADTASLLQAHGIAASVVYDASDAVNDDHLWERGYFGLVNRTRDAHPETYPHAGPAWGHGPGVPVADPHPIGADSVAVLRDIGGYTQPEIDDLFARGAADTLPESAGLPSITPANGPRRIERGELSRLDPVHDGWRTRTGAAQ